MGNGRCTVGATFPRMQAPMAPLSPPLDRTRSLEAALRHAASSGAWIVAGSEPGGSARNGAPPSQPIAVEAGVLRDGAGPGLEAVRSELGDCRRCRLAEGRTQIVFGVGDPGAEVVFVGEGPGEEEDRRGEPFVGRAGQLLDRMLAAIGLDRSRVYIANVVKCRPPGNRTPLPDEASACLPFLRGQIEAIRPRILCALGAHAAQSLLGTQTPVSRLRGRPLKLGERPLVVTYHPAYLLRNPAAKRQAWEDLKSLRRLLDHRP